MVKTMKWAGAKTAGRVIVIAGAGHLPPVEFADFIYKNIHEPSFAQFLAFGAKKDTLNDAFYDYFAAHPSGDWGSTVSIFNFLKGKDFAILIPRNMQPKAEFKHLPDYIQF
ncbi:MAG TPA: hypothetical protein VEK06_00875, partial [Myxococcota bacterium]|nr:hypothetical protein [Myxococcota bacterium]